MEKELATFQRHIERPKLHFRRVPRIFPRASNCRYYYTNNFGRKSYVQLVITIDKDILLSIKLVVRNGQYPSYAL
jgi:hypothetical protein